MKPIFLYALRRTVLVVFGLMLCAWVAWAQMEPNAPVRNFILPRFSEDGNRIWVLRGQQGIYVNPSRIDVQGMQLRVFSRDDPDSLALQIESPQAIIRTRENRASGPGTLLVLAPTFSIAGQNWEWDGNTDTVQVRENVRVAFSENLADILR